jgi:hypothetical protein
VPGDLPATARGIMALTALLLLPGLLVVRAPGTAVPFLSAAFWMVSWWWLPADRSRSGFLGGCLLAFGLLAASRLLKPLPPLRPDRRTLLVMALAFASFSPAFFRALAPGLSLASAECRLLVWRDGLPATYEPLLPVPAFGAHAPGLPSLAADVALLGGGSPATATWLTTLGSLGLLMVAAHGLATRTGRSDISLSCVAVLCAGGLVAALLDLSLLGPTTLALALAVSAWAFLARGSGRSPAVAAGAFLAAALLAHAAVGFIALAMIGLSRRPRQEGGGSDHERRVLALFLSVLFAAPFLGRMASALPGLSHADYRAAPRRFVASFALDPGPSVDDLAAFAWLEGHSVPPDRICVDPSGPGRWIPALVGRAIEPPEVPFLYRSGIPGGPAPRACRFVALFAPPVPTPSPSVPASARLVFARGSAWVFATE